MLRDAITGFRFERAFTTSVLSATADTNGETIDLFGTDATDTTYDGPQSDCLAFVIAFGTAANALSSSGNRIEFKMQHSADGTNWDDVGEQHGGRNSSWTADADSDENTVHALTYIGDDSAGPRRYVRLRADESSDPGTWTASAIAFKGKLSFRGGR